MASKVRILFAFSIQLHIIILLRQTWINVKELKIGLCVPTLFYPILSPK